MNSGEKQYHIEGLRGLAIILIILFHMNAQYFPMGYLGVDIFLVISGYLLFIRPIQRNGEGKPAAAWNFIRRKTARIMWPLSVAVVITLAVGFFILVPGDLVATAKTARCALLGFSNTYLGNLNDGGYFASDASFNLMVPTWYLSLTCQVYVLFLVGWLVIPRKWMKAAVGVGIVLSFAYANFETLGEWWKSATGGELHLFRRMPGYYSFGTRIWEVLAGGVICLLPEIRSRKAARTVGALTLAVVVFLLFYETEARSTSTTAMVAATVFGIRYAKDGVAGLCLTNRVLLWFGKLSFSIYLIHMVIVTTMVAFFCTLGPVTLPVTFLVVLAASMGFHRWVEKKHPLYPAIGMWVLAMALAIPLAKQKLDLNGFIWRDINVGHKSFSDWRYPQDKSLYDGYDEKVLKQNFPMVARLSHNASNASASMVLLGDTDAKPDFVMMGDSHAAAFFCGMDAFCRRHGLSGVYLTTYVIPLYQWEFTGTEYEWSQERVDALLHWLEAHPEIKTVVLCQRWYLRWTTGQYPKYHSLCGDEVPDSMRKFIAAMKETGKQVVVMSCVPELPTRQPLRSYRYAQRFGAQAHMENLRYPLSAYTEQMADCNRFLEGLEKEGLCRVLHIEDVLFKDGVFDVFQDGYLLMDDTSHLAPYGAEQVAERCAPVLLELLGPAPSAEQQPAQ